MVGRAIPVSMDLKVFQAFPETKTELEFSSKRMVFRKSFFAGFMVVGECTYLGD